MAQVARLHEEVEYELQRLQRLLNEQRAALDAAETILRVTPMISTNAKGTRPNMTPPAALAMVRAAISRLDGLS